MPEVTARAHRRPAIPDASRTRTDQSHCETVNGVRQAAWLAAATEGIGRVPAVVGLTRGEATPSGLGCRYPIVA